MRANIYPNAHPNIGASRDSDIDTNSTSHTDSHAATRLHNTDSKRRANVVGSLERDGATSDLYILSDV